MLNELHKLHGFLLNNFLLLFLKLHHINLAQIQIFKSMKRSSDGKVVVQTKIATADQIESTEISAVSPVHKELSKDFLRSVFRSLESTLLFLSKSKQGSHWDKVVLAFHNLAGFTLERSLFSAIYSLFPQLYKLEWKILPEGPADRQLCVSLDSTFGPAELKVYSAAWIAARDFEFW